MWDAGTGRVTRRYAIGGRPALSPDGRALALALNTIPRSGRARPWRCSTSVLGAIAELATELPENMVFSMAFARDGTRIVAPSFAGTHVWDVASGEIIESYRNLERMERLVQRHRDRSAGARGLHVRRWKHQRMGSRRRAARRARVPRPPAPKCTGWTCSVIDPSGTVAAVLIGDGTVALADSRTRGAHVLPARDGHAHEAGLALFAAGAGSRRVDLPGR